MLERMLRRAEAAASGAITAALNRFKDGNPSLVDAVERDEQAEGEVEVPTEEPTQKVEDRESDEYVRMMHEKFADVFRTGLL
ncbi:hypothetical protein ACFL3C_01650 [Patescibacteria group bacterium]